MPDPLDAYIDELLSEIPDKGGTAVLDPYIDEILQGMPDPHQQFTDLVDRVPHPVRLPADQWVELLTDGKDEFEVDGTAMVLSTWRMEEEDPGDVEITDGMIARAGRLALDARMTDGRAAKLLAILPQGAFLHRIKFLRVRHEGDWVLEDKFDPVRVEGKKGGTYIEISRDTKPGVLTGIDKVYYQNAYLVTAVVYGLYPIRDPDPANLAPLRNGDLNCVTRIVVEHFKGALKGVGLTPARRQKIQEWEERVYETGASVDDVARLEKILKRAIILRDVAGGFIYNSGRYQNEHRHIEVICQNGHAWSKDLHFPQSREVRFYEGDIWQAIREATRGEPLAVWLLGGQERRLPAEQFVLQDGRTFRTQEAHRRLQATCAKLGYPEFADKAFGENNTASIIAKERNSWRPTPAKPSRRLAWSTGTEGCGTRWATIRGTSSASTKRPAIRHLLRAWVKRSPIFRDSGTQPTAQSMALFQKTLAQDSPRSRNGSLRPCYPCLVRKAFCRRHKWRLGSDPAPCLSH